MAIVTKIVDFSDGIPAPTYTMFASEKVSERDENCRFQPAYVRKAIGSECNPEGCELQDELDSSNRFYQYLTPPTARASSDK